MSAKHEDNGSAKILELNRGSRNAENANNISSTRTCRFDNR